MSLFHISTLVVASFLSALLTAAPVRADDPQPGAAAEEVARLQKIWADWKQKATSIEVEGFEFYGKIHADSQLSRRELLRLIQQDLPMLVKQDPNVDLVR